MRKKIIWNVLLILVCLVLSVTGTLAWFNQRFNLAAKNEKIQLKYGGITIIEYHVYKYIQETGAVRDMTIDETTGERILDNHYELTPFDSIFPERNVNTPLVFEMKLELSGQSKLYLNCQCEDTPPIPTDPTKDPRYSSNIMRIGAATEACIPFEDTDEDGTISIAEKFYSVADYFKEAESKTTGLTYSFVHVTEADSATETDSKYSFTKQLTLPVPVENKGEITGDTELTVYYILDYETSLVEAQEVDDFSLIEILQSAVPFEDDIEFTGFDSNPVDVIWQ